MRTDIITEDIWHFIGSFQQMTEAARGRAAYDAYRAGKAVHEDGKLRLEDAPFSAPHRLIEFEPGIKVGMASDAPGQTVARGGQGLLPLNATTGQRPDLLPAPQPVTIAPQAAPSQAVLTFELPPPGSVAVIIGQRNHLSDQDIQIQQDHGAAFKAFSTFDAPLQAVLAKAKALDTLPDHDHPANAQAIQTLGPAIATDAASLVAGNDAVVITGTAVNGLHLNGIAVATAPVLIDHMPDVPEPSSVPAGSTWEDDVAAAAAADATHTAVLGGNTLTNAAVLTVSWLDAPVMLVQGDAMAVSVISQINVLSDIDTGVCGPLGQSQLVNFAQHAVATAPLPQGAKADAAGFPTSWVITTIEADLVVCDWVTQQNFVIDHDILSVTWSGSSSFLRLGDNSVVNLTQLLELGRGYDLLLVGGDMISISMIRQMNVLLDADWVQTADGSATVSTGSNLLWNSAAITTSGLDTMAAMDQSHADLAAAVADGSSGAMPMAVSNPAFEGTAIMSVLYIKGDYLTLSVIEQTNILGDADQVIALANDATAAGGAAVTIITGCNALINAATIDTVGIDSEIYVGGEIYSDAVIYQADFIDESASDLYAAQGPAALASEAVIFLADGMLMDDTTVPVHLADTSLISSQTDGVNAVLA